MNEHRQSLLSLGRICAKLLSRRSRRQYSCQDHVEAIQDAFDVDVATDQAELHPLSVCEQCWVIAKRWKTAKSTGRLYRPIQKAVSREDHDSGGSCFACEMRCKNAKG